MLQQLRLSCLTTLVRHVRQAANAKIRRMPPSIQIDDSIFVLYKL